MKRLGIALLIFALALPGVQRASATSGAIHLTDEERALALAVELEVHANHLETRSNVCLGFGRGLEVDERGIIASVNRSGLKLHANEWCNRGPRGLVISIISPVDKPQPNTFRFELQLGDLDPVGQRGEHFGTLLRKGIYVIQIEDGEPTLVTYQKI